MTKEQRKAIHDVLATLNTHGRLTPDEVIQEAKNAESPLHSCFTWDEHDGYLANLKTEARILISSFEVKLIVKNTVYRVQEFVEDPRKPEREQGYISISQIKDSKQLAREFMDRELGIASTYVAKTKEYSEVLGLRQRVEDLTEELGDIRNEVRGDASASQ